jgi:hypothetical protein
MTKTHLATSLLLATMAVQASESRALQLDLTREALCEIVPLVVLAQAGEPEILWAPGPEGAIETRIWLVGPTTIKGELFGDGELVLPGGTLDDLTHWVEDVPTLQTGHSYLFFLTTDAAGETRLVGGQGGAVEIRQSENGPGLPLDDVLASLGGCDVR